MIDAPIVKYLFIERLEFSYYIVFLKTPPRVSHRSCVANRLCRSIFSVISSPLEVSKNLPTCEHQGLLKEFLWVKVIGSHPSDVVATKIPPRKTQLYLL